MSSALGRAKESVRLIPLQCSFARPGQRDLMRLPLPRTVPALRCPHTTLRRGCGIRSGILHSHQQVSTRLCHHVPLPGAPRQHQHAHSSSSEARKTRYHHLGPVSIWTSDFSKSAALYQATSFAAAVTGSPPQSRLIASPFLANPRSPLGLPDNLKNPATSAVSDSRDRSLMPDQA